MQNLPTIAIDWANVNWLYVTVLAIFVFFSAIIGTLLSFKHVFYGAVLSALLFATAFVFWNYYPHGLPLPTLMTAQQQVPANLDPTVRAHAKSPFYVVIAIQKITDPEAYKPLPEKGKAAAEAAGGHYIIRTGNITGLDGVAPERLALIEFDSIEKAQAWYSSPAQKDADAIRSKSTDSLAFIVEGLGK
jgi:uncharacterized protein (DUF1330 family)